MKWDDAADETLRQMAGAGKTLNRIADALCELGYNNVTRNSVVGRKHRLRIKTEKLSDNVVPINKPRRKSMTKLPPTREEIEKIIDAPGVEYLKLTSNGCKAILDKRGGDWDLPLCCGRRRCSDANGSKTPYCLTHYKMFCNATPKQREIKYGQVR